MFSGVVIAAVTVTWLSLVVAPRMYLVLRGRQCPCCESGRATFQGLAEHPWHRLRSAWNCEDCQTELHEAGWGRLEIVSPAD